PEINTTYQEMAAHYGAAVLPARAYRPRDKAKAESAVLVAERWILARLRNQRFSSISDVNPAIWDLVDWINNRPYKVLPGSRRSVFEELDRPALRPLPETPYEFATWNTQRVNIDYHIEVRADRHFYSVPYQLAKERVEVRLSAKIVEIYYKSKRVASHPRSSARFAYSTDPAHMPESHRRYKEWTPERILSWAERTGPMTK
ncbi:Integrase catalytic region, partial [mine drainage metagenome]